MNTGAPPIFPNETDLLQATPASTAPVGASLPVIIATAGMPDGATAEACDCARVALDTLFCRAWIERRLAADGPLFRRTVVGDRIAEAVR
ncbi:hypothetical protein J2847_005841 [Azospirillum agricola]|uniref:hypothetical protein n=1 Tax=Azospirillum agricola TaxID=1720247 RepID=UPI001AE42D6A|nr:hypothetical protein [Azospirillum agricola]MBP2232512.1 hypothetical protein [Azospirillum agricola]